MLLCSIQLADNSPLFGECGFGTRLGHHFTLNAGAFASTPTNCTPPLDIPSPLFPVLDKQNSFNLTPCLKTFYGWLEYAGTI